MKFLIPAIVIVLSVPAVAQQRIIRGQRIASPRAVVAAVPVPCAEERVAWEQADQALTASVGKKNSAETAKTDAEAAVTAAQAALEAATAQLATATEEYDTAVAAVQAASTAATAAYGAYVECRAGQ